MTGGVPSAITKKKVIGSIDKTTLESLCLFFLTGIINIKKKKREKLLILMEKLIKVLLIIILMKTESYKK